MTDTDRLAALLAEHRECGKPYDGCYSHLPMRHCRADGMALPCDVMQIAAILQPAAQSKNTRPSALLKCEKCGDYESIEDAIIYCLSCTDALNFSINAANHILSRDSE